MLNLIVNAIQSMRDAEDGNRELHISTVNIEPEGVCVAVRDTGQGLHPESLPRLFEPFYTTKSDGMGIGLSICRSIVEAHGGQLWRPGASRGVLSFSLRSPLTEPPSVIDVARLRFSDFTASSNVRFASIVLENSAVEGSLIHSPVWVETESMMGPRQVDNAALFYEFSLERHTPATYLLRAIDRFVDCRTFGATLAPFYSSTGRPLIDPELLFREEGCFPL
jgi:hypothetical protein